MAFDYDDNGAPVAGAFNYDENGNPISAGRPAEEQGDVARGFTRAFAQVPELAYGTGALAAMSAEKLFGEGGLSTTAKNYFGSKFAESHAANQQYAPTVEFTDAWDNLGSDPGKMVDWIQDSTGYVVGQGLQTIATGGLGALAGKMTLGSLVAGSAAKAADKMVAAEAAKRGLAGEAADAFMQAQLPAATAAAARNLSTALGSGVVLAGQNLGMEAGDIYGGLIEESKKTGKEITGADLIRAWGAAGLAAGTETVTDLLGLGALTGRIKIGGKAVQEMTDAGGRAARAGIAAGVGIPVEGAQEWIQTGLEQWGAGQPLNTPEAAKERINAAAVGALGGAVMGGGIGALQRPHTVGDITDAPTTDDAIAAADAALSAPIDAVEADINEWKTFNDKLYVAPTGEVMSEDQLTDYDRYQQSTIPARNAPLLADATQEAQTRLGAVQTDEGTTDIEARRPKTILNRPVGSIDDNELRAILSNPETSAVTARAVHVELAARERAATPTAEGTGGTNELQAAMGGTTVTVPDAAPARTNTVAEAVAILRTPVERRVPADAIRLRNVAERIGPDAMARVEQFVKGPALLTREERIATERMIASDGRTAPAPAATPATLDTPVSQQRLADNEAGLFSQPRRTMFRDSQLRSESGPDIKGERVTRNMRRVLVQLARLTGTKVVFEYAPNDAEGSVPDRTENVVHINTAARINPLQVLGHEVTHVLRDRHGKAWSSVRDALVATLPDKRAALDAFASDYWGAPRRHILDEFAKEQWSDKSNANRLALEKFADGQRGVPSVADRKALDVFIKNRWTDPSNADRLALEKFANEKWGELDGIDKLAFARGIPDWSRKLTYDEQVVLGTGFDSIEAFLLDEMVSDLGGQHWSDEKFWLDVFAKIEAKEGAKAKGIIERLVISIREMLTKMIAVIRAQGQGDYVTVSPEQLEKTRDAVASAYAEFIRVERRAEPEGESHVTDHRIGTSDTHSRSQGGEAAPAPTATSETPAPVPAGTGDELDDARARELASLSTMRPVDTSSPEFKRWFGDSKVVDAQGRPLVVYRGDRNGKTAFYGNVFFSSKHAIGERYAKGGQLNSVYLSLKKPLVVDAKGNSWEEIPAPKAMQDEWGDPEKTIQIDYLAIWAREQGYDGLIAKDVLDQWGDGDQFVAFHPEQIKSAISNTGEFSNTDPDIRRSTQRPMLDVLQEIERGKLTMEGDYGYNTFESLWKEAASLQSEYPDERQYDIYKDLGGTGVVYGASGYNRYSVKPDGSLAPIPESFSNKDTLAKAQAALTARRSEQRLFFEAAPNPDDKAAVTEWKKAGKFGRGRIDKRVREVIVPGLLRDLHVTGKIVPQLGGWMDATNPSFALVVSKGDPALAARAIGHVLEQQAMYALGLERFTGAERTGIIHFDIAGKDAHEIYMKVRALDTERILGHSTVGNEMFIGLPLARMEALRNDVIEIARNEDVFVIFDKGYGATIREYGYGLRSGEQNSRQQRPETRDVDRWYREARALRSVAAGGRPDAAGSGSDRAGFARQSTKRPSYGEGSGEQVVGVHYSREQRPELSSRFFGTGMKAQERVRLGYPDADPRIKLRLYFYANTGKGIHPESDVGYHAHSVTLNNVYDMDVDPKKLWQPTRDGEPYRSDDALMNDFESRVIDEGFTGYMTREFGQGGAVVLLGDHRVPVLYEGERVRPDTDVMPAPKFSDEQALRRKLIADNSLPSGQLTGLEWMRLFLKRGTDFVPRWLDKDKLYYRDQLIPQAEPARMSEMRPVDTNSPAFKRWFGDSKVVDAEGRPLKVYHGTGEDFTAFADSPYGTWVTSFEPIAETFAYRNGSGGNSDGNPVIMPLYVSASKVKFLSQSEYLPLVQSKNSDQNLTKLFAKLRKQGYQAVNLPSMVTGEAGDTWVVFGPTQIKSAISNTGEFSSTNPDIRRSESRSSSWYYSPLARAADTATMRSAPAKDWRNWLKSLPAKGVKPDEIKWSGIEEWLAAHGDTPVTRDQVQAFLSEFGVKVETILRGERNPKRTEIVTQDIDTEDEELEPDVTFGEYETDEPDDYYLRERAQERFDEEVDSRVDDTWEDIADAIKDEQYNRVADETADVAATIRREMGDMFPVEDALVEKAARNIIAARIAGDTWQEYVAEDEDTDNEDVQRDAIDRAFAVLSGDLAALEEEARRRARAEINDDRLMDELFEQERQWYYDDSDSPATRTITVTIGDDEYEFYDNYSYGEHYVSYNRREVSLSRNGRRADDASIQSDILMFLLEDEGVSFSGTTDGSGYVPTKWADYRTDKSRAVPDSYREVQLTLPAGAFGMPETTADGRTDRAPVKDFYYTVHWQEANIVGFARFDEHIDEAGKRVMVLQEVQADWGQTRRRIQKALAALPAAEAAVEDEARKNLAARTTLKDALPEGGVVEHWAGTQKPIPDDMPDATKNAIRAYRQSVVTLDVAKRKLREIDADANEDMPADAPFVDKTPQWAALIMKRMIAHAVEYGFDKVVWTNGAQQVERWKGRLRKEVDRIAWEKTQDGVHIVASLRGIEKANTRLKENALTDHIGKVMAQQILSDPNQSGEITGNNITISDIGMAEFYDRMLVNVTNDVIRKLDKTVQVKDIEVHAGEDSATAITTQQGFEITDAIRKSAEAGLPLMSQRRASAEARKSHARKEWYRSQLSEAVGGLPTKIRTGKEAAVWLQANASKLQVKKDELTWSGVLDWLATQRSVTGAQIQDWLASNGVRVKTVVLGEESEEYRRLDAELQAMDGEIDRLRRAARDDNVPPQNLGDIPKIARLAAKNNPAADEHLMRLGVSKEKLAAVIDYGRALNRKNELFEQRKAARGETPKHDSSGLRIPGGKPGTYRELLLTLPESQEASGLTVKGAGDIRLIVGTHGNVGSIAQNADGTWGVTALADIVTRFERTRYPTVDAAIRDIETKPAASFRSTHYPQPNILAHLRFEEMIDADGKRVMFIQEVQSDWGQKGRKEGFAGTERTAYQVVVDGNPAGAYESMAEAEAAKQRALKYNTPEKVEIRPVRGKVQDIKGVPAAPFVTDTKAWVALALKRMISHAVDNGFDRVAWTTGEQQADRYSLANQVDELVAYPDNTLVARKNGANVIEKSFKDESELADLIGKEAARKLLATRPDMNDQRVLSGLDLKVGGKGMVAFYDGIVKQVARSLGATVGTVSISQDHDASLNTEKEWNEASARDILSRGGEIYVTDRNGQETRIKNEKTLDVELEENGTPRGYILGDTQGVSEQPGFDITDKMREQAAIGMPLFSTKRMRPVDTSSAAFRKWFGDSKVVDTDGKPLRVYHGTPEDFVAFDHSKTWNSTLGDSGGLGFFFSDSAEEAGHYARSNRLTGQIMPVYLSIKNPKVIEKYSPEYDRLFNSKASAIALRKDLMAQGYDGARTHLGEYVAFSPAQIKSAISNTGKFDPTDPDIRRSERRALDQWLGRSVVRTVMYHGTARDITTFRPQQADAIFLTDDPEFAANFADLSHSWMVNNFWTWMTPDQIQQAKRDAIRMLLQDALPGSSLYMREERLLNQSQQPSQYMRRAVEQYMPSESNIMPLYVRAENPFDYRNPEHVAAIEREIGTSWMGYENIHGAVAEVAQHIGDLERGDWNAIESEAVQRYIRQHHDSFYVRERGTTNLAVFSPNQVKSASGNSGAYSREDNDIRRSTPRSRLTGQPINQSWTDTPVTDWDDFVRKTQDSQIDTKRVLQAIRDMGISIAERFDVRLMETNFAGRAATRVKNFTDGELRKLLEDMTMHKLSIDDLNDYLWARHAPERNAANARTNPGITDGSGMTDAQSADILAGRAVTLNGRTIQLSAATLRAAAAVAPRVDAITNGTLDLLVQYGLETQQTVDTWRKTYGSYVPLKRDMESDSNYSGAFNLGAGTGSGFDTRGPASRRAMGSKREVIDILANVAMQRERAITRGEKNRVAKAVYGLALTAPNPEFWIPVNPALNAGLSPAALAKVVQELVGLGINPIDAQNIAKEPVQRYIDPRTGLEATRINPALRNRNDVLSTRINGEDRFVMFSNHKRAQEMVRGLKNLDAAGVEGVLRYIAPVTRWFASVNTQFNPIFGVTNGIRDLGTGMINLSSTPLSADRAKIARDAFSALRGVYVDLRDHRAGRAPTSQWAQLFEQYALDGGQTGYRDMFLTSEERAKAIANELKAAGKGKQWVLGGERHSVIFGWLSDYNTAVENAVRLAAYKAALDRGMSRDAAASLAKNLTVNFNRKGTAAIQTGALYAFFNASVQGTARMAETMSKDGKLSDLGKKIAFGGVMVGVLQAVLGMLAGWDDDEPPQFVREKNFLIPLPGTSKYLSVPMPLGFHVLPNIGRNVTEWLMSGGRDPGKRALRMANVIFDSFNPIGGGTFAQTLSPTIGDPLIALSENKDWTGKSIYREDMNKMHPTPGWTRAKDVASPPSRWFAYALNYVTGGGKYEIGIASPTPDQIDYLIGQATGGVGREVLKIAQYGKSQVSGEELPIHKTPLGVGRFIGETKGQASETSRFYENLRRIGEHKSALDEMKDARDGDALMRYLERNPDARLVQVADKANREIGYLRRQKRELVEKGGNPERVKLIEEKITTLTRRYNEVLSRK